jgi:uncharacterized SAM-binding protein YcdF (DUF218 family)
VTAGAGRPVPGRVWRRAAEGATLGALGWTAAEQLGLPRLVGASTLWGLVGATVGAALFGHWRPAVPRALAGALAALLLVVAYTPLAPALLRGVVRRDVADGATPAVDAVAVLSAEVQRDGLVARHGLERLLAGAEWARRLGRPLVLSVVRDRRRPNARSSEADQRRLAALAGVPAPYFVDSVRVTRDEAVREAALARRMGWRRLLVVTSPSHSRRACAAYEHAGVEVVCAPSPAREYALGGERPLAGPIERVGAFRDWLYEALGWWSYRARGWV